MKKGIHIAAAIMALGSILTLAGCADSLEDWELYDRMEQTALEGQWAQADRYARQYILRHPHDPAGHFYLGFRYLHSERPWFGVALGQYRLALRLFEEGGRENPIPRFPDADTFEALCHLEISKVYQKQLLFLLDAGAPRDTYGPILDNWQAAVDIVREIDPGSDDVQAYDQLIQDFRHYIRSMPPSRPNNYQLESI